MQKKFKMVNYGESYQLSIASLDDLKAIDNTHEAFWVATNAPTDKLNCPQEFIDILDRNNKGRILSSDLKKSVSYLLKNLKSNTSLGVDSIALDDLSKEGQELFADGMREILKNLEKGENENLSLTDLNREAEIVGNGLSNGDGVIPPGKKLSKELQEFIQTIILVTGGTKDINGKDGVNSQQLQSFITQVTDAALWRSEEIQNSSLKPFGENTSSIYGALNSIKKEIEEYFQLCKLLNFNNSFERDIDPLSCPADVYDSRENIEKYLSQNPIAKPREDLVLDFNAKLNPYFAPKLKYFQQTLDSSTESLTYEEWQLLLNKIAPYEAWQSREIDSSLARMDLEKLQSFVESPLRDDLKKLLDQDSALAQKLNKRHEIKELILLRQNLLTFCNNFVSFPHLYDPQKRALFEAGSLTIDGRIFNFNIPVKDVKQHSAMAERSGIFLIYLEVSCTPNDKNFFICTPITSRRIGLLGVGKRGVFLDLEGKEWDARIVKVVENPVSLTEAALAPFKKLSKILFGAVDKISSGTEKQLEKQFTDATSKLQKNVNSSLSEQTATATKAAAPTGTKTREILLTGSVTFAALGSSFAYISNTFAKLEWEQGLAALAIGLLIITLPVLLVASVKLHRRNISSILEASGWAINARMRLTRKLARILAPRPTSRNPVDKSNKDLLKNFSEDFEPQQQ